ncbi:hypothetical protein C8R48DRAFT_733679 [Suillus tomentosus]|nr:hypothetical protein C8R48DRAFT_733679 [Suillus tomentosus]
MTHFSNAQPTRQKGSVPPDAIIRPLVERYAASEYSNPEEHTRRPVVSRYHLAS